MTTKKTLSCVDLHHSVFLAPDQIRTCCKRFFIDGTMRGDVVLINVKNGQQPTPEQILERKKALYERINRGEKSPCSGCPWLTEAEWPSLDELDVRSLSFEAHSVCNLKCTYCSDTFYGGKDPQYDVPELYASLQKTGSLQNCSMVVWGGGEPLARKDFETNISRVTQDLQPSYNRVFTNGILYSERLSHLLTAGSASITTSIDAGTPETYRKVRGSNQLHRVLGNLRRYLHEGAKDVTIKYIFTEGNTSLHEVSEFVRLAREYELLRASYQISSDFKHETLNHESTMAAISLYLLLRKEGASAVFFDDHIQPRINSFSRENLPALRKEFGDIFLDPSLVSKVVVWGAGQYTQRLLETSFFFSQVDVEFFVDRDNAKVGREFFRKPIKPTTAILENELPIFIGASGQYAHICEELTRLGADAGRILNGIVF